MDNELQQRQIIEHYVKAYNAFDVAGMVRDLHPEIIFENISDNITNLRIQGISAFKQQAEQAAAYFREREQRIRSVHVAYDVAEVKIDYSGVVAADLPNGLKAGDTVNLHGKSMFYFKGNKIIKLQDIS